jgi:hypothetical protein
MYYVIHKNNTAMSHTGSIIYVMDMKNIDEFITTRNANRMVHGTGNTLAIKWILEGPVGVMIASNMGRPGGACSKMETNPLTGQIKFKFQELPNASTQEESVLTCINHFVNSKTKIEKQLSYFMERYGMKPATGNPATDFLIKRKDGSKFDVRWCTTPSEYAREFGSSIPIYNPMIGVDTHDIYLSFIAGPNAATPSNGNLRARAARTDPSGRIELDTVFRTISIPAHDDYMLFKKMISAALVGSLNKMADLRLERVIFAAPSAGIYAGIFQEQIQREYYELCVDALHHVRRGYIFNEVIIPHFRLPPP